MAGLLKAASWFGCAVAAGALALTIAATAVDAKSKSKAKPDEPLPALDFVGTWAKDAASCKEAASTGQAPVVFTAKQYNQYETHCQLSSIRNAGALWTANANCTVQGDKQRHSLMMTVAADAMDLGWDAPKGQKLVRCK